MFSDFNPDADNLKQYPILQTTLENNYGENIESFIYRGEKTQAQQDETRNLPSWFANKSMKKENEEKATQYLDDISRQQVNRVVQKRMEGKDSLDLLQSDPDYIKLFTVLSKDLRGNQQLDEIQLLLKEPVSTWEDRYFNSEAMPSKKEVEAMIKEVEHPNERKSKYVY